VLVSVRDTASSEIVMKQMPKNFAIPGNFFGVGIQFNPNKEKLCPGCFTLYKIFSFPRYHNCQLISDSTP
jgi:hypothetical protein